MFLFGRDKLSGFLATVPITLGILTLKLAAGPIERLSLRGYIDSEVPPKWTISAH